MRLVKSLDLIVDEVKKNREDVGFDYGLLDSEKDNLIKELIKSNASLKITNSRLKDDLYNLKQI